MVSSGLTVAALASREAGVLNQAGLVLCRIIQPIFLIFPSGWHLACREHNENEEASCVEKKVKKNND